MNNGHHNILPKSFPVHHKLCMIVHERCVHTVITLWVASAGMRLKNGHKTEAIFVHDVLLLNGRDLLDHHWTSHIFYFFFCASYICIFLNYMLMFSVWYFFQNMLLDSIWHCIDVISVHYHLYSKSKFSLMQVNTRNHVLYSKSKAW